MADLRERVEAEFENIAKVTAELAAVSSCHALSTLERAGVGALLQSFYNGIENVLKQLLLSRRAQLPDGPSWHRDLVNAATELHLISGGLARKLGRYLAFRHFLSHGYSVELEAGRLEPLVRDAGEVFGQFQSETSRGLSTS